MSNTTWRIAVIAALAGLSASCALEPVDPPVTPAPAKSAAAEPESTPTAADPRGSDHLGSTNDPDFASAQSRNGADGGSSETEPIDYTTITFTSVGPYELGTEVPSAVRPQAPGCVDDVLVPGELFMVGSPASQQAARITGIYVKAAHYETTEGINIGTELATLRKVYGDRLVVDRADGPDKPTEDLLGLYQDVAGVRSGDSSLTFYLREDAVTEIKVAGADEWGDDEGCL